jgi:hypothetical protein
VEGTLENTRGRALTVVAAVLAFLSVQGVFASDPDGFAEWTGKRTILEREAERLAAAYSNCVENLREAALDVTVPVEVYPDGTVKTSIKAAKVQFFQDSGFVWGEGVIVSMFSAKGELEAQVKAERCIVDRSTKSGWASGRASVRYGGTEVCGENVYFSAAEEYVSIARDASVVSSDLSFKGVRL